MHPADKSARVAGVLYLLMGAPAVFSLMYVPKGSETLFRLGIDSRGL